MVDYINQVIDKVKKNYNIDYMFMLSAYNHETQTIQDYNGRQILELLQNCDDEGAKRVMISIDQEARIISIKNNGTPFSPEGYRSLLVHNVSSKTDKKRFIGNKGLGFRSIINWCEKVEITSDGVLVSFSEENRKTKFHSLFSSSKIDEIRINEDIGENEIPLPFLSFPHIELVPKGDYVTNISITYKEEFLGDILKQVEEITNETIFFLKNIQEIKFTGFDDRADINCKKRNLNSESSFAPSIEIMDSKNIKWNLFEYENVLPKELWDKPSVKEYYQIMLAINDDLNVESPYLFSYFPTKIQLKQPYLIHATFDLDASRNQLNDTKRNKFLLNEIVAFLFKVAEYYKDSSKSVSYFPWRLVYHEHQADSLDALGYYKILQSKILDSKIIPCISNAYNKIQDCIYISKDFGNLLVEIQAEKILNTHILPEGSSEFIDSYLFAKINIDLENIDSIDTIINEIGKKNLTINQRARFIYQIVRHFSFMRNRDNGKYKLSLLIDDKGKNIQTNEYVFTPITKDNVLQRPSFANIKFIHSALYYELSKVFSYEDDKKQNRSRFVANELNRFFNIHSYEPANLIEKIVSETKTYIQNNPNEMPQALKEMHRCLYSNYRQLDEKTKVGVLVPILALDGSMQMASNLVFSNSYEPGIAIDSIFVGIYGDSDKIADPSDLGFEGNEESLIEFLLWIGVNRFAIYQDYTEADSITDDYRPYLFSQNVDINNYTLRKIKINTPRYTEKIISGMSLEKLIAWLNLDLVAKNKLDDSNNGDEVRYFFYNEKYLSRFNSFLKWRILEKYNFEFANHLLDDQFSWANSIEINYKDPIFKNLQISKTEINLILLKLGALEDFDKLPISRLKEIINHLPTRYPDGRRTQLIYKKALGHFQVNHSFLEGKINLFANDGEALKVFENDKIYFSDKIKLPSRLMKDFPIFNFPMRSGGNEAISFFGINDLSEIQVELKNFQLATHINDRFQDFFKEIKPLLLVLRINEFEDLNSQKSQASICNKISIKLCSELNFSVNDKEYRSPDYEFIKDNSDDYYLKVEDDSNLKELLRNVKFLNSCAQIVSEAFDVKGKQIEFKSLFEKDIDLSRKDIEFYYGKDLIYESRSMLGLSKSKEAFWSAVFSAIELHFELEWDDNKIEEIIRNDYGIKVDLHKYDYDKLNEVSELIKLQDLFENLNVDIEVFSEKYQYPFSTKELHKKNLITFFKSKIHGVKNGLWSKMFNDTIENQSRFLEELARFEDSYDYIDRVSDSYSKVFCIDLEAIFNIYVDDLYGEISLGIKVDLDEKRENNLKDFNVREREQINSSIRWRSLIYFDNAIVDLQREISEELVNLKQSEYSDEIDVLAEPKMRVTPVVFSSDRLKPGKSFTGNKRTSSSVYVPSGISDKRKKAIGDKSEREVFNYLKKHYDNVYWASRDNEGLHYDMRYENDSGEIKYVEVKTLGNGRFIMSRTEFDFGEENQANYEIWLVHEEHNLIPIRDFFTNEKYTTEVREYNVYVNV